MLNFSTDKYAQIISEIHERVFSAETLATEINVVFVESTSLQIRKVLELVAYLSVLTNNEKLNSKERHEWHPRDIIRDLNTKTTIFFPFPCHIIPPCNPNDQPTLIPLGYKNSLSQEDFVKAYQSCGNNLHAQHPFKKKIDIEKHYLENKRLIKTLKSLLQNHAIGIRHEENVYTFLYTEIDFSNNEATKPIYIREYKTHIFDENQLKSLFNTNDVHKMAI